MVYDLSIHCTLSPLCNGLLIKSENVWLIPQMFASLLYHSVYPLRPGIVLAFRIHKWVRLRINFLLPSEMHNTLQHHKH